MVGGEKKNRSNPRETANVLSIISFCWIRKLFWRSYKKGINEDDLFEISSHEKSKYIGELLETAWHEELLKAKSVGRKPSFMRTLVKLFWLRLALQFTLLFLDRVVIRMLQSYILGKIIEYFGNDSSITNGDAYIYTAILTVISIVRSGVQNHFSLLSANLGIQLSTACCTIIYHKILLHNKYSMNQLEVGKVLNFMASDVARFEMAVTYIPFFGIVIAQAIVIVYLVWQYMGPSSLVGMAVVTLCTIPFKGYMAKRLTTLRSKIAVRTDQRMRLMNEFVSGIQVIKMYAWEKPFAKLVSLVREQEIAEITRASNIKGLNSSGFFFVDKLALIVTITTYSLFGNLLLPEKVFPVAYIWSIFRFSIAFNLDLGFIYAAECVTSFARVQEFLLKDDASFMKTEVSREDVSLGEVRMKEGCARWTSEKWTLEGITMNVNAGSLCCFIGPVGSGKSSLLQVLLDELPLTSGTLTKHGAISYASQEAWIFVGTGRENILFGQKYDPIRYHEVVKACALDKDFKMFAHGDNTLIGERGITLSGGQRARINLARAVYRKADIYILDDPLSAVDTYVGKQIFENCIKNFLRDKTRILVTHQLQYLHDADHIIVLNEGIIESQGPPAEIMESNINLAKFIAAEDEENSTEQHQSMEVVQHEIFTGSDNEEKPTQAEHKEELKSKISYLKVHQNYFLVDGNICFIILMLVLLFIGQIAFCGLDYWLSYWSSAEKAQENLSKMDLNSEELKNHNTNEVFYLVVYWGVLLAYIFIVLGRSAVFLKIAMRASQNLHDNMFEGILNATMRFFDTNPVGRILNRFSKDTGDMDEVLPTLMLLEVQLTFTGIGYLVMITITNYYMVGPAIVLLFGALWVAKFYAVAIKNCKRLQGVTRSPVYSHVTETVNGISTIRASQAQNIMNKDLNHFQDQHYTVRFISHAISSAVGFWLEFCCTVFLLILILSFFAIGKENLNSALVGLAVSQAMMISGLLQYWTKQFGDVADNMASVGRILEYADLDSESSLDPIQEKKPSNEWPEKGVIEFRHLFLQYGEESSPVLRDINLTIQQNEKVGIVGRTGAGKSSLIIALFRLTNIEGSILIDNVDTSTVGLHDLRKKISIIPQEPVLFSATLRYNLDPFSEFSDEELWTTLEDVELKGTIESLDWKISDKGGNLSVGQRQLVCLARAILRKSRILVLDEATANVDLETDALIQRTIRKRFQECTVLTIAHRLNTIMDSDKVLVMEAGAVVEFDHPHILLQNKSSLLTMLVNETSKAMGEALHELAHEAYSAENPCVSESTKL